MKLLWDTTGIVVRVHADNCQMLRTARERNRGHQKLFDATPEAIADFVEREYKVVYCKCTKETK